MPIREYLSDAVRLVVLPAIRHEARKHRVNEEIAVAIAQAESICRAQAIGASGERGLYQFDVATWSRLMPGQSYNQAFEPELNIRAGIRHLAENRALGEQDVRNYVSYHNSGKRHFTDVSARYRLHHPNRIYARIYRDGR